jgi:hypothetical protein
MKTSPKIYIVTSGEYSDYHIEAVFSTKELAESYIEDTTSEDNRFYDDPTIEIYEIDGYSDMKKRGYKLYYVSMEKDGSVYSINETDWCPHQDELCINRFNRLTAMVKAKSEKHAIKIVNERRAYLIANDLFKEGDIK